MIKAVIFDKYETLITLFDSYAYFSKPANRQKEGVYKYR